MENVSGDKKDKMNTKEKCPDQNKIMDQLKDFQRKSVKKVFRRLYIDSDRTNRFLIADEVGLGKTLVARGVIAKSVEYLWEKVKRIDVIYICSNREIASQNISRLNITSEKQFSLASRLTLLPLKVEGLKKNKLNFISFTPGTSFDLHSRTGLMLERALIYHMLKKEWKLKGTGPINVFQDYASKENWRYLVKNFFKNDRKIDDDLTQGFLNALYEKITEEKSEGKADIQARFFELCKRFRIYRKHKYIPIRDRSDVRNLIGKLRMILAQSCLDALEPDLVILDEFQRFKYLLDGQDEMSQLAQHLFNYKNEEVPTKIILLSATPYKMYTLHHEENVENHYDDFIKTVKFLFSAEEKTKEFEGKLKIFRNELFSIKKNKIEGLKNIKKGIENDLRKIMIRTERLAHTWDRNGMIREISRSYCNVDSGDLENFLILDKVSQEVGTYDIVEYWKSAPYLLNFMDNYEFKLKFKKETQKDQVNLNILKLLKGNLDKTLRWETISSFQEVIPANAKLRALIKNGLDKGSWKMLWVPPSLPYYKPLDVYQDKDLNEFTKSLIFSSWQIVPKAISMICSYEAERRMVTAYREAKSDYREERKGRKPLLLFKEQDDRLRGMANLSLLYPCLSLAAKIDPLEISLKIASKGDPPSYRRMKPIVRDLIKELLDEAVDFPQKRGGRTDERWYWASLALLDRHFYKDSIENWFNSKEEELKWEGIIIPRGEGDKDTYFKQHVKRFKDFFMHPEEFQLGRRPRDLIEVLTKQALASPAIVALRSLSRLKESSDLKDIPHMLQSAASISAGFRILFNLPESITLIRSLYEEKPYWEGALDYGISGNLQSVMDEYIHILKESLGLIDDPFEEVVMLIAKAIYSAVSIRTIRSDFDDIEVKPRSHKINLNRSSIRCRYALRLGEGKNEGDEEITRSDQVRAAFNSPFRPFLLASTSIGQEGLDFHQYCHSIYHWNLPANPVDLEQREGRIHRYKGHVIRKNVAKHFGLSKLKRNRSELDPWDFLFEQAVASRKKDKDDIVPFWIFETENGFKIDRHIPCMPLSRDIDRLKDLKSTLVTYRMVFGQPRQEDLVEFLKKYMDSEEIKKEMENFRIDLSPR